MKLLISILIFIALAGCAATKKNVSIQAQRMDSTASETKIETHSLSLDSAVKTIDRSIFARLTETGFKPFEIDSIFAPLRVLPGGGFVIQSPKKGKQIMMLPTTTTSEKGLNNIETETHLQKKDTSATTEKKAVAVHSEKSQVVKNKISIGFNWWWLLLLLLLPLISPQFRQKIIDQIKKLIP